MAKNDLEIKRLRDAAKDLLSVLEDWNIDEQMENTRYADVVSELETAIEGAMCSDCDRPIYDDDGTGQYRHLIEPERGCFLIRAEEPVVKTYRSEKLGRVTIPEGDES
jgi:hypothetical protein